MADEPWRKAQQQALAEEERCAAAALERSMHGLRQAFDATAAWIRGGKGMPPADLAVSGLHVQQDVTALLRVREWRKRLS